MTLREYFRDLNAENGVCLEELEVEEARKYVENGLSQLSSDSRQFVEWALKEEADISALAELWRS